MSNNDKDTDIKNLKKKNISKVVEREAKNKTGSMREL